jgi:hypothetical protein
VHGRCLEGWSSPLTTFHPLTAAPGLLRTRFGVRISYQRLWSAVVAGDIPAEREGRAWLIKDEDMAAIAAILAASAQRR